jgi:hypothetical protein
MNTNELAVYLEDITDSENSPYRQAATMLRQQQIEIKALKNAKQFIQNFAEEQHQRAIALEVEIEALKKFKVDADALDKKLFESIQKANEVWDKATKSILKKV